MLWFEQVQYVQLFVVMLLICVIILVINWVVGCLLDNNLNVQYICIRLLLVVYWFIIFSLCCVLLILLMVVVLKGFMIVCKWCRNFRFLGWFLLQRCFWWLYGFIDGVMFVLCFFFGSGGLFCNCLLCMQKLMVFRWKLLILWFSQNCVIFNSVFCILGLWKFRLGCDIRKLCRQYCLWCVFYCYVGLLKIDNQLLGGVLFGFGLDQIY